MAGLDLIAMQDLIQAHIETAFPNYEVVEDEILDDEQMLKEASRVKPFIVLRWHGLFRSPNNASFAGVRHDEYSSAVDVVLVAPNPRIAKVGLNMLMMALIGWQVPDGSQLVPEGGNSVFPVADDDGKPHTYLAVGTLGFQMNTSGIGS